MDSWGSSSSLIMSDVCDIMSSTLAVSGSVSTVAIGGVFGDRRRSAEVDEEAEALGVAAAVAPGSHPRRAAFGGFREAHDPTTTGRSYLRPHRKLSITLSDPDRLQPEMADRTLTAGLRLPSRRASSLRDHFRRRQALTVEDSDHDYLSSLSSSSAMTHKRRHLKSPLKPASSLRAR